MSDAAPSVVTAVQGHVAEIRLNRPDARNSITMDMHDALTDAFLALREAPVVRVIVLCGAGPVFSAGGDFDMILAARVDTGRRAHMRAEARRLLDAIGECPVPVVVALHGDVVGLGTTLLLCADAVVAARGARISDPHVQIGLVAGDGGCVLWPLHAGLLRARRYLLTGDRLTAEDAYRLGLVSDLVDTADEALPAAHALAARIAALPPLAVRGTKAALIAVFRHRMGEVFESALSAEMETLTSDDVAVAIAAIRERRRPSFEGR